MSLIRRIRRWHLPKRARPSPPQRWDDRAVFATLLNEHLLRDIGV
jgi:uncharacterized protein YjiS (DUF1127 family)